MSIVRESFGMHRGRPVEVCVIANSNGLKARLSAFGACLVGMEVPDRNGCFADIALGFDRLEEYEATDTYFGAICGRYANRIGRARIDLDGRTFALTANEGDNHLHGGRTGFDKRVWDFLPDEAENAAVFTLVSQDDEEGYPGRLEAKCVYTLHDDDRLSVVMSATTDSPTVVNMVQHAYWNLAGHGSGDVRGHLLQIEADAFTPVDAARLPTGEILDVAGTPFDFRTPKPIGAALDTVPGGGGYDHNWVLRDDAGSCLRPAATLLDPGSGRRLSLRSSEPGLQVYTGGQLDGVAGKGRHVYRAYAGVALETQKFPDSPNRSHFPSARLDPGETYRHEVEFLFSAG